MSAPQPLRRPTPKAVIKYRGIQDGRPSSPGTFHDVDAAKELQTMRPAAFVGEALRFAIPEAFRGAEADEILRLLDVVPTSDPVAQLIRLIDARAEELPLPDACVVIETPNAAEPEWADALTALAILTKASSNVWLRSKQPRLSAVDGKAEIILLAVQPGDRPLHLGHDR